MSAMNQLRTPAARRGAWALAAALLGAAALPVRAESLTIANAWARATPPGVRTAAAYLTIANDGAADRLLEAASPAARVLELHTHRSEGGLQRMVRLPDVALPAGGTVRFEPGGLHVMLIDIAAPLTPGMQIELTLRFENASPVTLSVPVVDARSAPAGAAPHRAPE